ncbi:MAG: flagellar assembly protein FliH [Sulfurimonas sp.]|nr:flagellar assembly protein FliH [Sulfurimonas sp.]
MAKVISSDQLKNHTMEKYTFKVIAIGANNKTQKIQRQDIDEVPLPQPIVGDSDVDSSSLTTSSKDSLIESLLKKTDEMSSNFIKLQMKLEVMTDEQKKELQKTKDESFAEGVEAGILKAKEDEDKNYKNSQSQFSKSVSTLEASAAQFEEALEKIKSNLIDAALDISKEVIAIELSENSAEVAKLLSNELIKNLQNASKITLKVNSKDHGEVSKDVGSLEHVEIISDDAVSPGGVIVLSDAGNIDAQVSKRFENVKNAALSE